MFLRLKMAQNMQHFYWDEERVNQELRKVMKKAFADLMAIRRKHECNLRTAAFVLGVSRVKEALDLRGL